MKLLLDSHTLLWSMHEPEKLAADARSAVENGDNQVFFSSASVWELAIKSAKRRLALPPNFLDAVLDARFVELPVRAVHAWAVKTLPPLHADPFDRVLVCQARLEDMSLVTRDSFLADYHVSILRA